MHRGANRPALGSLGGMPGSYPVLERPSDWPGREGTIGKDVEIILEKFAGLFQELPERGKIRNRAITSPRYRGRFHSTRSMTSQTTAWRY